MAGGSLHSELPIRENDEKKDGGTYQLSPADREQLYQPITGFEIRLLEIRPSADFDADLICHLIVEDIALDHHPTYEDDEDEELPIIQYEALSYCWGSPVMTQTIQCNGVRLPVTETLLEALRYIRLKNEPRLLWTDSCCINQSDLEEKARQVEMMFIIFQRAAGVVAWVGTSSEGDELVCRLAETVDEYDRAENGMSQLGIPMKVPGNMVAGETDPHADAARGAAWTFITTRPFFQRTWIRQEVFAARRMVIICGRYANSFMRYSNVLNHLLPDRDAMNNMVASTSDSNARALRCYRYLTTDHQKHFPMSPLDLDEAWFHIVLRSSMYKSTLPQDKVFGVLSLAAERTKIAEMPHMPNEEHDITRGFPMTDYSKPVSLVYQDFVKHHINVGMNLKCLDIFHSRATQGADLPSWAVDLRADTPRWLSSQQLYYWGIRWEDEIEEQDFGEHGVLRLRGVRVAKIGSQAEPGPWAKDYPRSSMGCPSPMLRSCVDADEEWFPEEDGEDTFGSEGAQQSALLDKTLERLGRDCGYTWKAVGERLAPLATDQSYSWATEVARFPSHAFHYHAFASDMAKEGDVIVHLGGAEVPYVLRPADRQDGQDGRWIFLGPAFLTTGLFRKKKIKCGKAVFEHEMVRIDDEEFERGDEAEDFVLV